MRKRIQRTRITRTKKCDRLIELSAHRYEFVPAWAERGERS